MITFLLCLAGTLASACAAWKWRDPRFVSAAVVGVLLCGVTGYFGWRETASLDELAQLVEPVPEIEEVTYVPTAREIATLSRALKQVPNGGVLPHRRAWRAQTRQDLAGVEAEASRTPPGSRSWLIETRLSPARVMEFYRGAANRRGFTITFQNEAWLTMERSNQRLQLFVRPGKRSGGASIAYMLKIVDPAGRPPR